MSELSGSSVEAVKSMYDGFADAYKEMVAGELDKDGLKDHWRWAASSLGDGKLLDVGCGTGNGLEFLVKEVLVSQESIAGIDVSSAMVKLSSELLPGADIREGQMLDDLAWASPVAAVVCLFVAQHLQTRDQLGELVKLWASSAHGKPAKLLLAYWSGAGTREWGGPETVGLLFSKDEVEDALSAAGYTLESTHEGVWCETDCAPEPFAYVRATLG
jgi:SAM-dependent methyltransferase